MRFSAYILVLLFTFSCGTNFFLNKQPTEQLVVLTKQGKTLEFNAKTVVAEGDIRMLLHSDFYGGDAEIVLTKDKFNFLTRNLPIKPKDKPEIKKDLYAAFFAGDYPYKSDIQMFGKAIVNGETKKVYDKDDYQIYTIIYGKDSLHLENIIKEYSIDIKSSKPFLNVGKSD